MDTLRLKPTRLPHQVDNPRVKTCCDELWIGSSGWQRPHSFLGLRMGALGRNFIPDRKRSRFKRRIRNSYNTMIMANELAAMRANLARSEIGRRTTK